MSVCDVLFLLMDVSYVAILDIIRILVVVMERWVSSKVSRITHTAQSKRVNECAGR